MSEYPWEKSYPEPLSWGQAIPAKLLTAVFDEAALRWPDNLCLDFLGREFSYLEVAQLVDRAAKGFQDLGVQKGDRVGLYLPNCPQYVICYFGILKAGGIVVNFSPLYAEEELLHQVEDSGTKVMVTLDLGLLLPKMEKVYSESSLEQLVVGSIRDVLPWPKSWLYPFVKAKDLVPVPKDDHHVRLLDLLDNDGDYTAIPLKPKQDIALIQYTGGTTGVAKGAMLSHANVYANTVQASRWFTGCVEGQERMLGVLPFFHVFAMTVVLLLSLHKGAAIIIHPRFELEAVLKDIEDKRPTMMPGVPTMFAALCHHPSIQDYDLSSIKQCISGGAPLPVEVRQEFEQLTGCHLVEGYGLTEASPVLTCNPLNGAGKAGAAGLPLPQTEIFIVDREDRSKRLPLGEPGEVVAKGPQVMLGYWQRPEATAETFIGEGALLTGDVGFLDEDGYLFLIDRKKDLILTGGFNVYPRHVEEAIYRHPAVNEVIVLGIPHKEKGEVVKAFISLREGHDLDGEKLRGFLADKLGRHEIPAAIEFRDELPKTLVGKLSKKDLRAEIGLG